MTAEPSFTLLDRWHLWWAETLCASRLQHWLWCFGWQRQDNAWVQDADGTRSQESFWRRNIGRDGYLALRVISGDLFTLQFEASKGRSHWEKRS